MLVLSRRVGERVVIDGGIVVTLVRVANKQVRLAFDAPPEVAIYREELCQGDGARPIRNREGPAI